ncbi:MAG TPA: pantetheine-phosphate adenylyltransferase [Hydrogenothermaceae bacterium]|nr:pantetheine-phosphate adenylyltransferase [Hydrogenothermaceae bacterium]
MIQKTCVYPGTFDPFHNGHLDIVKRALKIFETVIIAVAENPRKKPMFTLEERVYMIKSSLKEYKDRVIVEGFDILLVDFMKKHNTNIVIRGVRLFTDFEYELQVAMTNFNLDKVETFFMMPSQELIHISSSIVKDVALHNGDVSKMVPKFVEEKLREKVKCL